MRLSYVRESGKWDHNKSNYLEIMLTQIKLINVQFALDKQKIKRVNQKHRVILVMKYHILGSKSRLCKLRS